MKKINGKYYDLDPTNQVADYWNGLDSTDPNYCKEILYRAGEGIYSLYGEHGKEFDLTTSVGDFTITGEEVLDYILPEAMGWLASYDRWDLIEKELTDQAMNEKRKFSINELKKFFNEFMNEFISLHPQLFNDIPSSKKNQKKNNR